MIWDEWRFSSRIAWENPLMRWGMIATLISLLAASAYSGYRLFSLSLPSGYVVTHYTVYLGIDQVLPYPWLILILLVPVVLISATMTLGYYFYRQDVLAGASLLTLSAITTVIWIIQLFHLIKINI
ncbi:hypothetical protein GF391_03450 [Candidatus Uhrbacteria bacterium]|nr:hypothetical protein [Candidatus Uhrbacteria bacterium]